MGRINTFAPKILQLHILTSLWINVFCRVESNAAVALFSDNFDRFLSDKSIAVVYFYASGCKPCKAASSIFEEAAQILKSENSEIVMAKVDAGLPGNSKLRERFKVEAVPEIKILKENGGLIQSYVGPRKSGEEMADFLKQQNFPTSYLVETEYAANFLVESQHLIVVAFVDSPESLELKTFLKVAEKLRAQNFHLPFYHSYNSSIFPQFGSPISPPLVRIYHKFESKFTDIKELNEKSLPLEIMEGIVPLVVLYDSDPNNYLATQMVHQSNNTKVFLILDTHMEEKNEYFEEFYRAAKEFKRKFKLDFVFGDEMDNYKLLKFYELTLSETPALIIHDIKNNKKNSTEDITVDQVFSTISDFVEGKLYPVPKSEPIPKGNNFLVTKLVNKNLEQVAFNSGKNVLIEFYAPWCRLCQFFESIYKEVGKYFKNEKSLIVAKIDATANDIPEDLFEVKAYPTFYFVDTSGKKTKFSRDLTKENLLAFVEEILSMKDQNSNNVLPSENQNVKDEL